MGIALTKTNAASMLADYTLAVFGGHGPLILLAGLFIFTTALTQAVNGAAVAAIIGPIAVRVAQETNTNPRALAMGVALATSISSPSSSS